MILVNSVGVMGAQLELRSSPDAPPRPVEAIVLTCGIGGQGEIQIAIPAEIVNEVAEQMRLMNSNIVKAKVVPENGSGLI